jgi:glutamate dehydrogenase (NAD(P)+)
MSRTLHYVDPEDGLHGWLVYDGEAAPLAAGGFRVASDLNAVELAELAARMTLKQRVLGTNVDGAKGGMALPAGYPGSDAVLTRFLGFLKDELCSRLSLGPDMGTDWNQLQRLVAAAGVASPKYAIRHAQGLTDAEFHARMRSLDEPLGRMTLAQRRAGHALAHAALAAAAATGAGGPVTVALQGFGTLGRAAAYTLLSEGAQVSAIADEHGCLVRGDGLDIEAALGSQTRTPVPKLPVTAQQRPPEEIFSVPARVLVLAASSDAMSLNRVASAPFGAVVVGANCGLSQAAEDALGERGVLVVPDFIGGIGGSASMEALFGPHRTPSAAQVLENLTELVRQLVDDVLTRARDAGCSPRDAALRLAAAARPVPGAPPYGQCTYLPAAVHRAGTAPRVAIPPSRGRQSRRRVTADERGQS